MALQALLQIIQAETVLCMEMGNILSSTLKALMQRDNSQVQEQLAGFNTLSESLAQAEAVRSKVYQDLCNVAGMDASLGMGALIQRVDDSVRPAFSAAMRDFRVAVQRLRSHSGGIASYSNAQLITLESFMGGLVPDRHTGTYGADGSRSTSTRPMLVNSLS